MKYFVTIIIIFSISACTSPATPEKSFVKHMYLSLAVTHEILRLDTLAQQDQLTELQRDDIRIERSQYLTSLLDTLIKALEEEKNSDFTSYSARMSEQNSILKHMVKEYDTVHLSQQIETIEAICIACHKEHRD